MPCGFHAASSPASASQRYLSTSLPSPFQFSSNVSYQLRPLVFFFFSHSSCCAISLAILVDPGHRRSAACKNLVRKSDSTVVTEGEGFERVSIFFQPSIEQRQLNRGWLSSPLPTPNTFPDWDVRFGRMRMHS